MDGCNSQLQFRGRHMILRGKATESVAQASSRESCKQYPFIRLFAGTGGNRPPPQVVVIIASWLVKSDR